MARINLPGFTSSAITTAADNQVARPSGQSFRDRVIHRNDPRGDLLLVMLDASSSMIGLIGDERISKMDAAKTAFDTFISKSSPHTEQIGLIKFDSRAEIVANPTNNFADLIASASSVIASGSTAMGEALLDAIAFPLLKRGILISDGEPDNRVTVEDAVESYVERKIPIDTIFIGREDDHGVELMRWIAERTGGFYFTVSSLASFQKTFAMLESQARLQLTHG